MAVIRSFRDLDVYQLAVSEAREIDGVTRRFPREEMYLLTDQIRRSSRAVGAMIAEAWARRRYPAVFVNKMDEALGEANETQCWLDHACGCQYISPDERRDLDVRLQYVGAMIRRMIDSSEKFCGAVKKR